MHWYVPRHLLERSGSSNNQFTLTWNACFSTYTFIHLHSSCIGVFAIAPLKVGTWTVSPGKVIFTIVRRHVEGELRFQQGGYRSMRKMGEEAA